MKGEILYMDSSALVKLVLPEAESPALVAALEAWPARVSSELAGVEVIRAARRASPEPAVERRAEEIMAGIHLLKIDGSVLERAARLEPRTLRSLDAIHLASVLSLGEELGAVVIYDGALAAAAADCGLEVMAPGLPKLPG
jgi:predicted nucleic acid-binding protein